MPEESIRRPHAAPGELAGMLRVGAAGYFPHEAAVELLIASEGLAGGRDLALLPGTGGGPGARAAARRPRVVGVRGARPAG
jgi:hypothetical protein